MITAHIMPLTILLPLVGVYLILLVGSKYRALARKVALLVTGATFVMVCYITYLVSSHGKLFYYLGGWAPPLGIELQADPITAFLLLTFAGVGFSVILFAYDILPGEINPKVITRYYALYLVLLASLLGIVLSNDFFNIYVFLEISSIAAAALVAINGDKLAMEASIKYLIMSTLGSGTVLMGIAGLYMVTGYLNLDFIAGALPVAYGHYPLTVLMTLAMLTVGIAVKAALFPLHVWLPDAHGSAPTSSSAILSGLVVKVYIAVLLKLLYRVFPLDFITTLPLQGSLLVMATLGIFIGSILAIRQKDIKKMLAYSTVAQIGYVFLGIGLFSEKAMVGAIMHVFNHAVMKSMLFLSAGLLIKYSGRRNIADLAGLGRVYPLPMIAFSVGALSMVGIPPLSGFISKWYLGLGALEANQLVFLFVLLLSSLLNGFYYLPIVIAGFFQTETVEIQKKEIPIGAQVSLVILIAATFFFGLFSNVSVDFLTPTVQGFFDVLGGGG
ncbi:MAG: monovalent cation/H+ antiporter subunit D family protein [Limnochordia bacterium]|nr:monovalent cation/H+ antiporter subunit D family protein [Limnochordia bacterium]